jgi:hypothetical protein
MTAEFRESDVVRNIGTLEQENQDDTVETLVKETRADVQEILDGAISMRFWLDTRSVLAALSSKYIPLPTTLRSFHNRTTWVSIEHKAPEYEKEVYESWKITLSSISGREYPSYEFISTEKEWNPDITEEILDNEGERVRLLRSGIAAPSDLPLIRVVAGFIKEAASSGKIHSAQTSFPNRF